MTVPSGIDELREDMQQRHLTPLWELEATIMGVTPSPQTSAWLWRWSETCTTARSALAPWSPWSVAATDAPSP